MRNTFGSNVTITLFGESHGPAVGCVIDGLTPGIDVDDEAIRNLLSRRRPSSIVDTPRREPDNYKILSGVFNGKTTGTPICIMIPNEETKSGDYLFGPARPSHADYTAHVKYNGFEDYRGGGHFSGRITSALVAAGGTVIPALNKLGISIGTHISECGGQNDRDFSSSEAEMTEEIRSLQLKNFPVLSDEAGEKMIGQIEAAAKDCNSLGGIVKTAVTGLPVGVGEPWFDSLESQLAHAMFSVGAVKGIQFGSGFEGTRLKGSEFNDPMRLNNGRTVTLSNNNGGINGGISNGMPVTFSVAVKPTPSIARPQQTVNFLTGKEEELVIHGRHDPAIVRRICPVIDSVTAIVIADALVTAFGPQVLVKGKAIWNTDL
ncbi:MAG: chorismate synthase [Lachnospiraceae bacterium]|nr:chorismate synthase [Lachnospiraceae bacterium]